MTNHPNRARAGTSPARNPTPEEIRAARDAAGLSKRAAAAAIFCAEVTWEKWERGERSMHPSFWRDFRREAGLM